MPIRQLTDIQRDIAAWLQSKFRVVDTGSGTVMSSLLLNAIAQLLADANTALAGAELAQGISAPSSIETIDLDNLAYNFSLTRKDPSPASGLISFRRDSPPASTIQIGADDGSGGIIIGTVRDANGSFISFSTTETVFLTSDTPADPVSGLYEVIAPIIAVQAGTSGNVGAGAVNNLITNVSGITSAINKTEMAGGSDTETNAAFAARLTAKVLGMQPGILEGLRAVALSQPGVLDASVVGPDNAEFQRSVIGGVDLVIKGVNSATAIDTFTFNSPIAWTLQNRPATSISSVISTVGATLSALTPNIQWSLSQDATSENRGSVNSNDYLGWMGTSLPNSGADVIVSYVYDALIKTVQDIVNQDNEHYPGASVLVKNSTQATIDIYFSILRDGTISSTTITNNISTVLAKYLDSLPLGALISQSNLVSQIKSVPGIKQLILPFSRLAIRGSGGASDVQLSLYQYPILDISSLRITYTN